MYKPSEDRIDFRFLDSQEAVCDSKKNEESARPVLDCFEYILWCREYRKSDPAGYKRYAEKLDIELNIWDSYGSAYK